MASMAAHPLRRYLALAIGVLICAVSLFVVRHEASAERTLGFSDPRCHPMGFDLDGPHIQNGYVLLWSDLEKPISCWNHDLKDLTRYAQVGIDGVLFADCKVRWSTGGTEHANSVGVPCTEDLFERQAQSTVDSERCWAPITEFGGEPIGDDPLNAQQLARNLTQELWREVPSGVLAVGAVTTRDRGDLVRVVVNGDASRETQIMAIQLARWYDGIRERYYSAGYWHTDDGGATSTISPEVDIVVANETNQVNDCN